LRLADSNVDYISQGNSTTCLGCDGIFNGQLIAHLLRSMYSFNSALIKLSICNRTTKKQVININN